MREAGSRQGPLAIRARNTGRSQHGALAIRAARHTGRSPYGPLAIRGGILRDPAPLLSPVFPPSVTHPAVGVPPHCHTPTKVARNLIRSLFEIARKRCNSNDAISYLQVATGELRATLVGNHHASCPVHRCSHHKNLERPLRPQHLAAQAGPGTPPATTCTKMLSTRG